MAAVVAARWRMGWGAVGALRFPGAVGTIGTAGCWASVELLLLLCCINLPLCATPPAVRGLLLDSRKAQSSHYVPGVAEGVLVLRPAAAGGDQQGRHAAGLAAAAGQQAQVAMLCLERLIALGECCLPSRSCLHAVFLACLGLRVPSLPPAKPTPAGPPSLSWPLSLSLSPPCSRA